MKLWHIAALLIAGIAVGIAFPFRFTGLFGQATLYVFLPALIFEAAWHLDFHIMRRMWKAITLLAIPGVLVTAAIVTLFAVFFAQMPWGTALLLGAILCATDPVAVITIFRRLEVPRSLATIVESESLFNDAITIVVYRATVASIVFSATTSGVAHQAAQAALGVLIGIGIGLVVAYVAAFALHEAVNAYIQSFATLICAYGGYFVCDYFGWSGMFFVLTFGIALRELERRRITIQAAEGVSTFWTGVAVVANVILFFLIGAALDLTHLRGTIYVQLVVLAAVLTARFVLSYGVLAMVRGTLRPFWMTVVRMAGIRGALSLALALATPLSVPQRGIIVDTTFVVVVVTILNGVLTVKPRMERMPLND